MAISLISCFLTGLLSRMQCIQLDPSEATINNVKAALSTKNKKEAVDKLQQLMDQLRGVMTALQ